MKIMDSKKPWTAIQLQVNTQSSILCTRRGMIYVYNRIIYNKKTFNIKFNGILIIYERRELNVM
jgi:hypothetical protein